MSETKRNVSPSLEALLRKEIPVLDHGFIRVVDYLGTDSSIVQSARVSYGTGTKQVSQDRGLINYLMRHRHTSPFEMCEIKFHLKMPIFVARQWIRHRTANVNEYSARYSILNKEYYLPEPQHIAQQSQSNKQGRELVGLNPQQSAEVLETLQSDAERCHQNYTLLLEKAGLARELARMDLTLNYYTEMYWKIDLHNLLHFLSLRIDPTAQYEIRIYAEKILQIVKDWVPLTYDAFCEHRLKASTISKTGLQVIKRMLSGEECTQEESGLSRGEWRELMAILK